MGTGQWQPMGMLFSSLLGEMPTPQNHAWWETGQQIPENPFPAAFLCFNGHRAGNPNGERSPGSLNSHPFPPQLLLHVSTDDWRTLWSGQFPQGQNTHFVTLSRRSRRKKEPENWVLHSKV